MLQKHDVKEVSPLKGTYIIFLNSYSECCGFRCRITRTQDETIFTNLPWLCLILLRVHISGNPTQVNGVTLKPYWQIKTVLSVEVDCSLVIMAGINETRIRPMLLKPLEHVIVMDWVTLLKQFYYTLILKWNQPSLSSSVGKTNTEIPTIVAFLVM